MFNKFSKLTILLISVMPVLILAQSSQNIWITVSIIEPVSIVLTATNWDIGVRPFSSTTNRATPSIVSNACNASIQLALQITLEAANWAAATNVGVNKYALTSLIGTNQSRPAVGDYGKPDDVISGGLRTATATVYGNTSVSVLHGGNIAPQDKRRIWLKFETPTGGVTTQQTIRVTISATAL